MYILGFDTRYKYAQAMKRVWKISDAGKAELLSLYTCSVKPKAQNPFSFTIFRSPDQRFTRELSAQTYPSSSCFYSFKTIIGLFSYDLSHHDNKDKEDLTQEVKQLRDELVEKDGVSDMVLGLLEEKGNLLLQKHRDDVAFIELLNQLDSRPQLALEVCIYII